MRTWEIVDSAHIPQIWKDVRHLVQQACENTFDRYTSDDFLGFLVAGQTQLWLGIENDIVEAAALTDIVQFPHKKYARVIMGLGNNPNELETFIETFELWARNNNCDGVQSDMRPGFSPAFKNAGWNKTHITMEKQF